MKKNILKVLKDLYNYKYIYILRATALQLMVTTLGVFSLSLLFRSILISTDLPGITTDNILSFLTNPLTLALLVLYLFVLAFLVYFEFSLLVEMIWRKEARLHLTISRLKRDTVNFLKSLSSGHLFFFLLYLILMIPFLQYFFTSAVLENLYIPRFISGELLHTTNGKLLYYGLYAILTYVNLRLIYTLPLVVTGNGEHFGYKMAESWRLTKGKKIFDLIGLVLVVLILLAVLLGISLIGVGFAAVFDQTTDNIIIETIFLSFVWGLLFSGNLLVKLASLSYLLNLLVERRVDLTVASSPKVVKKKRNILALIVLLILIGGVSFLYNSAQVADNSIDNIQVIAHRGYPNGGVENSIDALEAAAKENIHFVEMDIILSKDNQFIVSHDNNLKRLAGKNTLISKSLASDVIDTEIRQNGHTSRISSFDSYVAKAKELGITLLVELKTTGSEPANYEQLFVDKLNSLEVSQVYPVMSTDLSVVEKVKTINKNIQTGFCISLQIGNFTSQRVDFYALEDFSYNELLASEAHKNGKKIYAWTINASSDIEKYLQTSVDGLITDYPLLVKTEKTELKDDNYFAYFLRLISLS